MPDFEVNEGYIEAGRRRADSFLPKPAAEAADALLAGELGLEGFSASAGRPSLDGVFDERPIPGGLSVPERDDAAYELSVDAGAAAEQAAARARAGDGAAELEGVEELGAGGHRLPERTPIVRRTRHLATGHILTDHDRLAARARRVGVRLIARRRRLARRACPYGWKARVLATPRRDRRRLWTTCHGQPRPPGTPS
jgi:hypothetical protein